MKIKPILTICALLLLSCHQQAQDSKQTLKNKKAEKTLPILLANDSIPLLTSLLDADFQNIVYNKITVNPRYKKLIAEKKLSIGVVDMSNLEHVKFANINGNEMLYAASLPKIAILLAVMDGLEKGEITETQDIQNTMRVMISKSSNVAATELIDLVGLDKIETVLRDPKYELYNEDNGGGLWVGKRYSKTGERHGDPIHGISHGATTTQICRFYYLLAYGKLVSYDRSKQMLGYMDNPEINHKFVNKIRPLAPKAHLYRKSGTWKTFHADSVLVWGPNRQYILVALVDDLDGEKILRDLATKIDNLLKIM